MGKRVGLSKRVRFEVFKRDKFSCVYCGACAPQAVLCVDHINPVAKNGDNSMMNLATSCQPCNLGKSDKLISDDSAISRQRAQLNELADRREQLELMAEWRSGMQDIELLQADMLIDRWADEMGLPDFDKTTHFPDGAPFYPRFSKDVVRWLKKNSFDEISEAISDSCEQYASKTAGLTTVTDKQSGEMLPKTWVMIERILTNRRVNKDTPGAERLSYIAGIIKNRLGQSEMYKLKQAGLLALKRGVSISYIEASAKSCGSWEQFERMLAEFSCVEAL